MKVKAKAQKDVLGRVRKQKYADGERHTFCKGLIEELYTYTWTSAYQAIPNLNYRSFTDKAKKRSVTTLLSIMKKVPYMEIYLRRTTEGVSWKRVLCYMRPNEWGYASYQLRGEKPDYMVISEARAYKYLLKEMKGVRIRCQD